MEQNSKFCPSCGSKLDIGDKFCAKCGFSIQGDETQGNPVQPDVQNKSKVKPVFILIAALIIIPLVFLAARTAVTTGTKKTIEDKLALAEKYLFDEEYEQAILAYREVIDIAPKEERVYTGLAKVYTVQEDYESAEEVLIEGIQIVDQKIPVRQDLADIYVIQEKYEEAEAQYLVILEEDENEQLAYRGLAGVYKRTDETGKLMEILERAIMENPDVPENYSLLAELYVKVDRFGEAVEMVKKALQLDINYYDIFYVVDGIFEKNWEGLIAEGDSILSEESYSAAGRMLRFYGLFQLGRYNEVISMHEELYEASKSDKVLILTALAFHRTGESRKAGELVHLIDIDRMEETNILKDLVYYFNETGDKGKAIDLAKKALRIDKFIVDFYLLLYELTGDEAYYNQLQGIVEPDSLLLGPDIYDKEKLTAFVIDQALREIFPDYYGGLDAFNHFNEEYTISYMDVTGDGRDEAVITPEWWSYIVVVRSFYGKYCIILEEIGGKYGSEAVTSDGFLRIIRRCGGTGILVEYMDLWRWDGKELRHVLDFLTIYSRESDYPFDHLYYEETSEITGPLTDFEYKLTNITKFHKTDMIVSQELKTSKKYIWNDDSFSFTVIESSATN
ncbi:zinc-ribbon domain-containing protein [Candidatus Contubernalis alkaliaceticus]|uniref:zinc-ribbon domain-containing protein n=1 Tax=Candidatus Contubernalis alkaliaceticus TaxID=338645 RepID=UPI001F4C32F0|nr:zinc-ribbon domain-containing protein [Candidatus Contubernalis alkalaceticus]UNC91101.1 zinc-ribbon domain-containing protein [Candidatus Contubernalis alkalaceticus]